MTAPMPLEDFTDDQTRRLADIEAAEAAEESFDAVAALRRVEALAKELEGEGDEHATYQRRYSEAGDHFGAVVSEREAWTSRYAADRIRRAIRGAS